MANIFNMVKKAASMKKEMKTIQDSLVKQQVEYSAGGGKVKVVARGDMSIESITIDPLSINPDKADRLEELLVAGINGALKAAKKKAGSEMSKLAGGMGLGDLMG